MQAWIPIWNIGVGHLFVGIIKVKKGNNSAKKLCNQTVVIIYKSQYGKKLACKLFSGISS